MSGKIPNSFAQFFDFPPPEIPQDPNLNNNTAVEVEPSGDELADNESMTGNCNTASDAGDTVSSSGGTIDPGNFSESDIDDDVSSSYRAPHPLDSFGLFPESDIEEEDDAMSDVGSAHLSFYSDLGSPVHSSCRSCAVSEDREDEREEATPLPFCSSIGADELKLYASGRRRPGRDVRTCCGSEKGTGGNEDSKLGQPQPHSSNQVNGKTVNVPPSARELRSSNAQAKRTMLKLQKTQKKRVTSKQAKKKRIKDRSPTPSAAAGSSTPGIAPVSSQPLQLTPPMPVLTPFDAEDPKITDLDQDGSTTRSLCIPILDLCITEDEGYLGMGEYKSESSDNDKELETTQSKHSTNNSQDESEKLK